MNAIKRLGEIFVDRYFSERNIEKSYVEGEISTIKIKPDKETKEKEVCIFNKATMDKPLAENIGIPLSHFGKEDENTVNIEILDLEAKISKLHGVKETKDELEELLRGNYRLYLYYDLGDGLVLRGALKKPEVTDISSVEEIFERLGLPLNENNAEFICRALNKYGSVRIGNSIEIGVTKVEK